MKSFKAYLKDKKEPKPSMETSFGSHSKKPEPKPSMETSFGSHSLEKKKPQSIDEAKLEDDSDEHQNHVHEKVAPEHTKKMSVDERNSLAKYTRGSTALNHALHQHHRFIPLDHDTKEHADHLTKAIGKHKTTEDTVLYTGIKHSPVKHFNHKDEHAHVHLPAFTSTTTSRHQAHGFSNDVKHNNDKHHGVEHGEFGAQHILKLHVPKGTSAVSVRKRSEFPTEHEVLLNRGHDIKIHPKPKHLGNHVYQWDAHVVGHSPAKLKTEDDED